MKTGSQTIKLNNTPKIYEVSNAVGPKEAKGPLGIYFDIKCSDVLYGEKTFEKAESKFITSAINNLFVKLNMTDDNVDYIFGGDLLNQCIATAYAVRELNIPFFGLYGACSTFIESIILSSILVDAGFAKKNLAVASSHFCSAERQFRFPLEHGNQKTPTSQSTVTGAGVALITDSSFEKKSPVITYVTPGKIIDMGIKDINNMGAAMAPAAYDTILKHFKDTSREYNYYDAIITGDLGVLGSEILLELFKKQNIDISKIHYDCGKLIYDLNEREINCGASRMWLYGYSFHIIFLSRIKTKKIK